MSISLEDIENQAQSGKDYFLSIGKPVCDSKYHDDYVIKSFSKTGLVLDHKPFLRGEKKDDLPVSYDEFIKSFISGRFTVEGFESTQLDLFKRAIRDVLRDLDIAEKVTVSELLRKEAEDTKREIEETKKQTELTQHKLEEIRLENERVRDANDSLKYKKKSKKIVKQVCLDEREVRRIAKEEEDKKKARTLKIKQSGAKAKIQAQRIKLHSSGYIND